MFTWNDGSIPKIPHQFNSENTSPVLKFAMYPSLLDEWNHERECTSAKFYLLLYSISHSHHVTIPPSRKRSNNICGKGYIFTIIVERWVIYARVDTYEYNKGTRQKRVFISFWIIHSIDETRAMKRRTVTKAHIRSMQHFMWNPLCIHTKTTQKEGNGNVMCLCTF